ncbi:DUF1569 domain-containing protein [Edaphobacter flagellatus]|uniref:DUF1569 domain-containing protein n=1 Tax=Edaphobacter flagellatus TaxID=1933044 RepID=UPI0021B3D7F8|nr:DUF1569 domain-containing protein [Edaphobacter flagellatus]
MKSLASEKVVLETRERLLRMQAGDCALWGRMTAPQMVRHLTYAYEVALGDRVVLPVKMKGLPEGMVKWIALRSGLPWKKNLQTTPELVTAVEEETTASFEELVGAAIATMESVAEGTRWQESHPIFGEMTAQDWMRWGYLHADHHLRQFGR